MLFGKGDIEVTRHKPIKSFFDVMKNLSSLLRYFTIWILILDILYLTGVIKGIEFFLIFIHVFIIAFCVYIFYYKYQKFRTQTYSMDITFKGITLKLIDFIFHYIPLFLILNYMVCRKKSIIINKLNIILIVLIPLLYFIFESSCGIYFLTISKCYQFYFSYCIILIIISIFLSLYTPFCKLEF